MLQTLEKVFEHWMSIIPKIWKRDMPLSIWENPVCNILEWGIDKRKHVLTGQ